MEEPQLPDNTASIEQLSELIHTDPVEGVHYLNNYYAILDIPEDASAEVIKKAYRTQISNYHPDKYEGVATEYQEDASDKARLIIKAYELLKEPESRAQFDEHLSEWREKGRPISDDGTPILSLGDQLSFQGEAAYDFYEELMLAASGYDKNIVDNITATIASLEGLEPQTLKNQGIKDALSNARKTLAAQLQKRDEALAAVLETQSESLGIDEAQIIASDYMERITAQSEERATQLEQHLAHLAIASAHSNLELESGELFTEQSNNVALRQIDEVAIRANISAEIRPKLEYFVKTATERAELAEQRLQTLDIEYPVEQPILGSIFYIGVTSKGKATLWFGIHYDATHNDAEATEISEGIRNKLETDEGVADLVQHGANVFTTTNDFRLIDGNYFIRTIIERHVAKYQSPE